MDQEGLEADPAPCSSEGGHFPGDPAAECMKANAEQIGCIRKSMEAGAGPVAGQIVCNGDLVESKYEGGWLNGRRSGTGRLTTSLPSEYDGEWEQGRRHGHGVQIYPTGNIYKGHWQQDMKSGFGVMKWFDQQQVYEGEWRFDKPDGVGVHAWFRSCPGIDLRKIESIAACHDHIHLCNRYRGEFRNGQRHGQGEFLYSNGAVYKGSWAHNLKHGPGIFTQINGEVIVGIWEDDIIQGESQHQQDVSKEHSKLSLDYHVECENLFPMTASEPSISESEMISTILLRYNDDLRRLVAFYGSGEDQMVPRIKLSALWTLFRDCNLRSGLLTRAQINDMITNCENDSSPAQRVILFREFHEILVRVSVIVFADQAADRVSEALNSLIQNVILHRFEACVKAVEKGQHRSSIEVLARMAPFEELLRSRFDKSKDRRNSAMPSRSLFQMLLKNGIPSDIILRSFNDTYRCDLTDNQELVISAIDIATDEVLFEEMIEIVGRCIGSVLTLPNCDVDLANWMQTL